MSTPFIRWPVEKLDALIALAQTQGKAMVEPEGATHRTSASLRYAIYRRLGKLGVTNITVMLQGTVVVLLDNTPPELKQLEGERDA